ncbi:unnamed protein product [Leuciscus chuanchicus]
MEEMGGQDPAELDPCHRPFPVPPLTPKSTHSQGSTPLSPSWSNSIHCSHDHKPNLRQDVPENISSFYFVLAQLNFKMSWTQPALLTCLVVLSAITLFHEADSSAVSDRRDGKAANPQGALRKIFMPESDASSFFKRRGRRSVKTQDEINAEQRQRLAADERRREYHEEQRNQFENYAEEEDDEQDERTRAQTEQWREYHHDGLDPSYEYNRHTN